MIETFPRRMVSTLTLASLLTLVHIIVIVDNIAIAIAIVGNADMIVIVYSIIVDI